MIARLIGTLADRDGNRVVLDVAGVGYEVFAPNRAIDAWNLEPGPVTVHVSTQVREDAITLYGFPSALERRCFVELLAVAGVGPKTALAALDTLTPEALARAVEADDAAALARVPGVGKKTAQKIAIDLKGKLPVAFEPTIARARPRAPADPLPLALAQLEYGRSEIEAALNALAQQGLGPETPLEERIRASLRLLAGAKR